MTFKSQRWNCNALLKKFYELYAGCRVGDHDKICAPHTCVTCMRLLTSRVNGSRRMPFVIPMVWREPQDLSSTVSFFNKNNTGRIQIQTYSEVSRFAIYNEVCATQWRAACIIAPRKSWLSAMTTPILMKSTDSKKWKMFIAIRHCKHVVPHLNPTF